MAEQVVSQNIAQMMSLLAEEGALLRAGRLREASALSDGKLRILAILESAAPGPQSLRETPDLRRAVSEMQRLADENAALLEAACNGVRALASRLEKLSGLQSVGTYERTGSRTSFSGVRGGYCRTV